MRATRALARFLGPYKLWALLAPLFMALEVAMDLMQPRLIEVIVDQGIAQSNMNIVLSTSAWMLIAALLGLIGGAGCTVFAVLAAQGFGADLRAELFRKVQALSFGNLDRLESGALITRLISDVTQVMEVVMIMLRIMVRVPLLLVGSLILAVLTSPQLALIFVVLMPIILLVLFWIIQKSFPMFSEVQHRLDILNTVMQENLAGVRVVKAFARIPHEFGRFRIANDSLMEQNLKAVRTTAITMPFMMMVMNIGLVATIWLGGVQITAGGLQTGQLIAFINYLTQALMSLMMISMLVVRVARAEASAQRIEEVLDQEPELAPADPAISIQPTGRIAFENVTFSYQGERHDPVLKQVSFVAEPGQTVALLGATGAGKSSLVNLIPRFYDVDSGRVSLDGHDVREIAETKLREAISIALQESILFSGTIRDNIRYARPYASEEEVMAAAKVAQAHDFISALPEGYDSMVGQRGVNLSGGQKQRIAIARAVLTNPAVLILDDSTSAVDMVTEARIQHALAQFSHRHTRIVVAQRISSVLAADKILVLEDGQVVAQGTHAELLDTSPIYQEIYESQAHTGTMSHD